MDREAGKKPVLLSVALGSFSCLLFAIGMTLSLHNGQSVHGGALGILDIAGMASALAFHRFLCSRMKSCGRTAPKEKDTR